MRNKCEWKQDAIENKIWRKKHKRNDVHDVDDDGWRNDDDEAIGGDKVSVFVDMWECGYLG